MTPEVAQRCVAMMKNKMMGRSFKKAERQWSQAVADSNAEKIKEA